MAEAGQAMSPAMLVLVAHRFRILGDPVRLQILQALQGGERSVTALTGEVDVAQPSVSKHLKVLQQVGFVGRRQSGTTAYFRIIDPLVMELCTAVCARLPEMAAEQADSSQAG
jgi:DNA-binding transcriptional ArsR family regulator